MTDLTISEDYLKKHIRQSLAEDLAGGDLTTELTLTENPVVHGQLKSRESGILAGRVLSEKVFHLVDQYVSGPGSIQIEWAVEDGEQVSGGATLAFLRGPVKQLLAAERVALNYLQQLSGVATLTGRFVEHAAPYGTKIYDTRKTIPHFRKLQKYAVRCGGGYNHRKDLSEAVIIKDNHKEAVGNLKEALARVETEKEVVVEIHKRSELELLNNFDIDVLMLDNMKAGEIEEILPELPSELPVEASGGINLSNVEVYASTGISRLSVGSLTHSFDSLDISLELVLNE